MAEHQVVNASLRERAERQIALAKATGSKAYPSADYRVVFVERRDGTRETVRLAPEPHPPSH